MEGQVGVAARVDSGNRHCTAGPVCEAEQWAEHAARSGILEAHNELHGYENLQHMLTVIRPGYTSST